MNSATGTDAGPPPAVIFPKPERLFLQRSRRLRDLAATVPGLSGYLLLLATLTEKQSEILLAAGSDRSILKGWQEADGGDCAGAHRLCSGLKPILGALVQAVTTPSAAIGQALARIAEASDTDVEVWVRTLRMGQSAPEDSAVLPFVAAALQIALPGWVTEQVAVDGGGPTEPGLCPACRGWPVASVLRTFSNTPGLRYLHCGLCASEWPYPRIQCVHCGSVEGIAYQGIEGADPAVQAETCDACRTYLKRIDMDKAPGADPLADDLATLALDMLLNEQGYQRFGFNPLLIIPAGS